MKTFSGTTFFTLTLLDAFDIELEVAYSGHYLPARLNCRNDDCYDTELEVETEIVGAKISIGNESDEWETVAKVKIPYICLSDSDIEKLQKQIFREEGIPA
jgi:hypothetical protein